MTAPPERNLTGVWTGLYTYADGTSVAFTATLLHAGAHLSGTIHEPDTFTGAAGSAHASVAGDVDGTAVGFRKRYDAAPEGWTDTVDYQGRLSSDGLEVEGRWRVPGWAPLVGTFLMIRNGGMAVPAAKIEVVDA